jgi:hypothetical protein
VASGAQARLQVLETFNDAADQKILAAVYEAVAFGRVVSQMEASEAFCSSSARSWLHKPSMWLLSTEPPNSITTAQTNRPGYDALTSAPVSLTARGVVGVGAGGDGCLRVHPTARGAVRGGDGRGSGGAVPPAQREPTSGAALPAARTTTRTAWRAPPAAATSHVRSSATAPAGPLPLSVSESAI